MFLTKLSDWRNCSDCLLLLHIASNFLTVENFPQVKALLFLPVVNQEKICALCISDRKDIHEVN